MNRPVELTRRETLRGVAVLAAAEKLTDGGFADVSYAERPARDVPVLPPGARSRVELARRCTACGRCLAVCPEKIIRPSARLSTLGQPELDFRHGACLPGCVKCGSVCPTGALEFLQEETKANVHLGLAVWERAKCLRATGGDACTACVRKCPVRAIHLVGGFPVVDATACVGCGACEHVCPARPSAAICVKGFDVQRIVRPLNESDLLAEMRSLLSSGASVVIASDGVIAASESGRGIAPVLSLLDSGKLPRKIVMDKVVGRAAAAICVAGGAKKVYAELMSADAAAFLAKHAIPAEAVKTVPQIMNRAKTGACPMELAVAGLEDPSEMVAAIRRKLIELKQGEKK